MVDVCFSDSLGGMLKRNRRELGSLYVLPLWLQLNYANLDGDIIEKQVRREIETAKYFTKNITEQELEEEYYELLEEQRTKHQKLTQFIESKQSFRLWLSNIASDRCGLYWFCAQLQNYSNAISVVWCPEYEYNPRLNVSSKQTYWTLLGNPNVLVENINNGRVLCQEEIDAYAREWERLVTENSRLRIFVDNNIVSVSDDFWDNTILKFVSHTPETQVHIMGKMLGKLQGGCDVAFISMRIEHLIAAGKIKVCEEKVDEEDCYWQRTIALA